MKTAKVFAISGTIIMFFTLVYGFIYGDFFKEGSVLISIAWGKVSLIDVYIGFFLFSGWVLFREQKKYIAVIWVVIFMVLGNFATCLYAAIALFKSNNDWKVFWLGKN
ncbi:MAG: DUF1475 domain-containing protein [Bacteroidales bacterium]|nr:MAG: DUF1475 domain-containing protein [Bacteroidales bacterium]